MNLSKKHFTILQEISDISSKGGRMEKMQVNSRWEPESDASYTGTSSTVSFTGHKGIQTVVRPKGSQNFGRNGRF